MKMIPIPVKKYLGMAMLSVGLFSCSDMLEVEPSAELDKDRYYQNEFDADAAVIGVYGKLMQFAEQYVVLNEARADLMDATMMADSDIAALNNHSVVASDDNKYADPRTFYEIIVNCNDALEGLEKMRDENRITEDQYVQRYSDLGAVRSWVYLQLGIHFGEVPYVTQSLESIDDVNNPSLSPRLSLPELVDELVKFMETLPYMDPYPNNVSLVGNYDGYDMSKFFVNKRMVLGDLYLWQGSYQLAAENYRYVMETGTRLNGAGDNDYYNRYKMSWSGSTYNVNYDKENDIRTLQNNNSNGWRSMFGRPSNDRDERTEWLWIMHYDSDFAPEYPFVRLFANTGDGEYHLKPSQTILDLWNADEQYNSFEFDARGILSTQNWDTDYPEVGKYTFNYDAISSPLVKNGKWFLERASSIHLKFAEAANRDNAIDELPKLARALVNESLGGAYTPDDFSGDDVTDIQNTLYLPYPYDFDARNGNYPYYRSSWYRHQGIRGRAYLPPRELPEDMEGGEAEREWTEDLIMDELAQELAFEGHRWPQLLRIAMRRNDPSVLADRVYDKMSSSNNPETVGRAPGVRAKLMAGDWFLPFHWEE
ncbi:RagB/SusD family protein [Echinicola strongylocentroti]|uniref:RagB/SusD family protein n=1 Tax=Echinicola strongylocentroti TaxID=1795355 RepID=A0A2Z4IKB1_9BACT|nr:RagB/SusD family nutrient uptake outer membrane protein [Echinicola strongylocentroti]AWW31187.1 RagB/SusD family protein [Echinicola strongylocentroti]